MTLLNGHSLSWTELFEALPDAVAIVDGDGVIRHVNDLLQVLTGYEAEELVDSAVEILLPRSHREQHVIDRFIFNRAPTPRDLDEKHNLIIRRKDGTEVPVNIGLSPLTIDGEAWVIVAIHDTRALRQAELDRSISETRFRLAFEDNLAPMTISDGNQRFVAANRAFSDLVGYSAHELVGASTDIVTWVDDAATAGAPARLIVSGAACHEVHARQFRHKSGRIIDVEVSRREVVDESGPTSLAVASHRDITQERLLSNQLAYQSLHDRSTGLPNRTFFENRLTLARRKLSRTGGLGAVYLLDIDDFKSINDADGYRTADQLLFQVSQRLADRTRSGDTLCRFRGDKFLYLVDELESANAARPIADRLLAIFEESFYADGKEFKLSASIGFVVWGRTEAPLSEFIDILHLALGAAKGSGKGRYSAFTRVMHDPA